MASCWNILDKYFKSTPYFITKHHLDSYDEFIKTKIPHVIQSMNPFVIIKYDEHEKPKHKIDVFVGGENGKDLFYVKPSIKDEHNESRLLFPNEARLKNKTYAVELRAHMHIKYTTYNSTNNTESIKTVVIKNVLLSTIPLMLHSSMCMLKNMPSNVIREMGECPYDQGGYFIVNGKEKVIIAQESNITNKLFINKSSDPKYTHSAFIRCTSEHHSVFPKTIFFHILSKETAKVSDKESWTQGQVGVRENAIVVTIPHINFKIPLFVLFRALGVESDKLILEYILQDVENPVNAKALSFLEASIRDANYIYSQEDALFFLDQHINHGDATENTRYILVKHLFPNMDPILRNKAVFLGYLANDLVNVAIGAKSPTDRDNYMFKRVGTSGYLLADIFKDFYNHFRVATRSRIDNIYNFGGWATKGADIDKLITDLNKNDVFGTSEMLRGGLIKSLRGSWGMPGSNHPDGIVQDMNRVSYMGFISHLRRVNMPMDTSIKIRDPHCLNTSQWGVMCPCESPDGPSIGLLKNLAMMCHITCHTDSTHIMSAIQRFGIILIKNIDVHKVDKFVNVRLNNNWIGCTNDPINMVEYIRLLRRNGLINIYTSVSWKIFEKDINILTEGGRCCRPLIIVDEGNNMRHIPNKDWTELLIGTLPNKPAAYNASTVQFLDPFELLGTSDYQVVRRELIKYSGCIEYIDVEETNTSMIAMNRDDLISRTEVTFTHCEIHPSTMFSVYTSTIPLAHHNQAPRNIFSGAQGKQAIGVYASNFNNRIDTMSYVLHYPQKPLVQTHYHHYLKANDLPNGENLIVAIMTYTGYNQEDSIIINKDSVERGMFNITYFKSYISSESVQKDSVNRVTETISFGNPNSYDGVEITKFANYTKLDEHGMPKKNAYIQHGDAIIGKVSERTEYVQDTTQENAVYKKEYKHTQFTSRCEIADKTVNGYVDNVFMFQNSDGGREVKVRLRKFRIPQLGDKLGSRHGQKGVVGMILPRESMPFTKDGLVPDIIINPHAFPSRMTIGHLIECVLAKTCAFGGFGATATTFNNMSINEFSSYMKKQHQMNVYGDEVLYNGITGEMMQADICIAPTYYYRLKQMVEDKINFRDSGKVVNTTKQPTKGRGNDGGLRIGEMETNVLIAHGISSFMKESVMERSDKAGFYIDKQRGQIVPYNKQLRIYPKDLKHVGKIEIPFAFKLFVQEMQTMSIDPVLLTDPDSELFEDGCDFSLELGEGQNDSDSE